MQSKHIFNFRLLNLGLIGSIPSKKYEGLILDKLSFDLVPYYIQTAKSDLSRYSDNKFYFPDLEYDFESVDNNQWIDVDPAKFRKEINFNYSLSINSVRKGLAFKNKAQLIV